jgi:hypothetical protein
MARDSWACRQWPSYCAVDPQPCNYVCVESPQGSDRLHSRNVTADMRYILTQTLNDTLFIFSCNCGACLPFSDKHCTVSMPKFMSCNLICGKNSESLTSVTEQVTLIGIAFDFVICRCAFLIWVRQGLYSVCVCVYFFRGTGMSHHVNVIIAHQYTPVYFHLIPSAIPRTSVTKSIYNCLIALYGQYCTSSMYLYYVYNV